MTPEERASACCSWWGIEGPGRIRDVTKAIRAAENDALEKVAAIADRMHRADDGSGGIDLKSMAAEIRAMKHTEPVEGAN
jgi:hypothetical protein